MPCRTKGWGGGGQEDQPWPRTNCAGGPEGVTFKEQETGVLKGNTSEAPQSPAPCLESGIGSRVGEKFGE